MNTRDLAEYLSGRATLTEGNYSSGGSAGASTPPLWTGRQERLQQNWRDVSVKLEALFLDVLDASEDVYAESLPILKDIRTSEGESCWENLPRFRSLVQILQSHVSEGDYWARYAGHMTELLEDLEWMCDQLQPRDDTVPEKPPKDKEDWQAEKDADEMGAPPPMKTFKPANESTKASLALPPICPSLVMASLGRAAALDEASVRAPAFRQAGGAVSLCMETYTDVESAIVDEGLVVPGGPARLDLVCEWGNTVGKASMHWKETADFRGLVIEGADTVLIADGSVGLTDQVLAEAIYECLNVKVDVSPRRVWEKARVVPELYRLIERHHSGEVVPRYRFEEALDGLSTRLGLNESVRLTPDRLTLQMTESVNTLYGYYWDWEQRYGEPAFNGDPDNGEPISTTFQTAEMLINLPEKKITLKAADGSEEDVPKDMTDEDASARLLSLGQQRESKYRLQSAWESNFRTSLKEDSDEDEEVQIAQIGDPIEAFEPETVLGEGLDEEFKLWEKISDEAFSSVEEDILEYMGPEEFNPRKHPRDDEGKFVDSGSADAKSKGKADYAARKKKKAMYGPNKATRRKAAKDAKKKKAQPKKEKSKEQIDKEHVDSLAAYNKDSKGEPTAPETKDVPDQVQNVEEPPQSVPDQVQAPPQVPEEPKPASAEDPGPADMATGEQPQAPQQADTTPPEQQQTFEPSTSEPEPKIKPDPSKSDVSRFNPDVDQEFGQTPEAPTAEPKRAEVPDAPSAPIDLQGAPKEEPSQEPDMTAQHPDAVKAAPSAPPKGWEQLSEPVSPSFQPEYRRPPEDLSKMGEQDLQQIRDYIYAQADQSMQTGNWDAADPEVQNVRKQAERDVDDMLREMQKEGATGGVDVEDEVRKKMRDRLEQLSDTLLQRANDRKDELSALEKEYGEKIVGFMGSLIGATWQDMQGMYQSWRSEAGYQ